MTAALVALVWAVVVLVAVALAGMLAGLLYLARLVRRAGVSELARRLGRRSPR